MSTWTLSSLLVQVACASSSPQYLSADFLTYRYYGNRIQNFEKTKGYPDDPAEVCATFYAECVNIRANQCVKALPDMLLPYDHIVNNSVSDRYIIGTPKPNYGSAGKYMYLSDRDIKYETKAWRLWSGCDEGCQNCAHGSGLALYPIEMPTMCGRMQTGDVFAIWWNSGDGNMSTEGGCVESLEAYWDEVDEKKQFHMTGALIAIAGVVLCGGACAVALYINVRRHKDQMAGTAWRSRAEFQRALDSVANFPGVPMEIGGGQAPRIIGQTQIDREFPVVSVSDEPVCVVCLLPVKSEDNARRLQCNHTFHANCILAWWVHTPRSVLECPVCKQEQNVSADETAPASTSGTSATAAPAAAPAATIGAEAAPEHPDAFVLTMPEGGQADAAVVTPRTPPGTTPR